MSLLYERGGRADLYLTPADSRGKKGGRRHDLEAIEGSCCIWDCCVSYNHEISGWLHNTFNSKRMKTYFWDVWWNSATYGLIWYSHNQINITAWWHMVLWAGVAIWTHMVTLLEKTQHNFILGSFLFVFVFKRETVFDFGSLSQTPTNLWWLLATKWKKAEANQSSRTMTRVR